MCGPLNDQAAGPWPPWSLVEPDLERNNSTNITPSAHLQPSRKAPRVDQPAVQCEDASENGPTDATHAMQAEGVQGVIHQVELREGCCRALGDPRSLAT